MLRRVFRPAPVAVAISPWHLVSLACALLWLLACNPYDPDLGERPFQCGVSEPRCPAGYRCVEHSASEQYCYRDGTDAPDGGSNGPGPAPFECADDSSVEPNDTIERATPTPIPVMADSYELGGLAVCPTVDVDIFEFAVTASGTEVAVDIRYSAGRGGLLLDLVNAAGGVVATSAVVDGDLGHLRAAVPQAEPALFYARVRAATMGIQNNYSIEIRTTPPE